jgi:N-formylglutamate amidohydrolase
MQKPVLLRQCSVNRLVVHVPHSSLAIPDDVWSEFLVPRAAVEAEALASADLYTSEMARQAWPVADTVEAEVSRVVVDVERYDDDNQEEMADVGRGVFYTCDHKMRPIRDVLSKSRRDELLDRYYRPHWTRLRSAAKDAVLIDLHTYPAEPWPIERHAAGQRPEIDIGFSEGLTPISWAVAMTEHFRLHGYEVGHNSPYAGVIDAGAMSAVMIEIRRDVVGVPRHDPKWCRLIDALRAMPLEG